MVQRLTVCQHELVLPPSHQPSWTTGSFAAAEQPIASKRCQEPVVSAMRDLHNSWLQIMLPASFFTRKQGVIACNTSVCKQGHKAYICMSALLQCRAFFHQGDMK